MKHHSYAIQLPQPKHINPSDFPVGYHVALRKGVDGSIKPEYVDSVSPRLEIRLYHAEDIESLKHDGIKADALKEISLLPPIPENHRIEDRLPPYDVKEIAEEVARQLFDQSNRIYLPRLLNKHPRANIVQFTHGKIWTPEIELAVMKHLKEHGYQLLDDDVHGLYGKLIDTNAILLDRAKRQ